MQHGSMVENPPSEEDSDSDSTPSSSQDEEELGSGVTNEDNAQAFEDEHDDESSGFSTDSSNASDRSGSSKISITASSGFGVSPSSKSVIGMSGTGDSETSKDGIEHLLRHMPEEFTTQVANCTALNTPPFGHSLLHHQLSQ